MKTITTELLDEIWDEINEATEPDSQKLARRMSNSQGYLMAYLVAAEERCGHPNLTEGGLLMVGIALWLGVERLIGRELPQLQAAALEAAEEENARILGELEEGPEFAFEGGIAELVEDYDQTPALEWVVRYVVEVAEVEPDELDEGLGEAILCLKGVIDAIAEAANTVEAAPED